MVVTVSASAVDPAVANDFMLSGKRQLTIEAGQMESTGTGTVTAVNNGVDAPSKTVEVTASVTGGNGVTAPAARTLTITDDEALPVVTLALDPASIGENGGVSTVTERPSRGRPGQRPGGGGVRPRAQTAVDDLGRSAGDARKGQTQHRRAENERPRTELPRRFDERLRNVEIAFGKGRPAAGDPRLHLPAPGD